MEKQKILMEGVTIDAPHSKDLDDGFWVSETLKTYKLEVAIADVASEVNPINGKSLFKQAFQRIETRYYATSNDPMLPRRLSEKDLSLLPRKKTPVVIFTMVMDKKTLRPISIKVSQGLFQNIIRLNFHQVDNYLKKKKEVKRINAKIGKMLELADYISQQLLAQRRSSGAMALYDLNQGWVTNEEGSFIKVGQDLSYRSYVIIQELMIYTNRRVTEYMLEEDIPIILRNHTAKHNAPDRTEILNRLNGLIDQPNAIKLQGFQKSVNLMLNKAYYDTELLGHYGLKLPAYTHWTSPIRRFADLVNQFVLLSHINGQELPFTLEELSDFASHINKVNGLYKKQRGKSFKDVGIRDQEQKFQSNNLNFTLMSSKDFYRMLKVAFKSEKKISDKFTVSLIERLNQGLLDARDFFLILFNQDFDIKNIRRKCLEYLKHNQYFCNSILMHAKQIEFIQNLKSNIKPSSKGGFIALSSFRFEDKLSQGRGIEPSKKGASHFSSFALLVDFCGLSHEFNAQKQTKVKIEVSKGENIDYISELMILSQKYRFVIDFSYEDMLVKTFPEFRCICKCSHGSSKRQSTSSWVVNKKEAKKLAAKLMYPKIVDLLQ